MAYPLSQRGVSLSRTPVTGIRGSERGTEGSESLIITTKEVVERFHVKAFAALVDYADWEGGLLVILATQLPVTPIIGRNKELSEIGQLISNLACRLLTLTSLGGIGETRLAFEAVREFRFVD